MMDMIEKCSARHVTANMLLPEFVINAEKDTRGATRHRLTVRKIPITHVFDRHYILFIVPTCQLTQRLEDMLINPCDNG
jgi:hypothetical protein